MNKPNTNETKDTITITLTNKQYQWVKAIADKTYKDACEWFYDTEDDGSEKHKRTAEINGRIRDLAEQILQIQPNT